jgi:hypothetical protein
MLIAEMGAGRCFLLRYFRRLREFERYVPDERPLVRSWTLSRRDFFLLISVLSVFFDGR